MKFLKYFSTQKKQALRKNHLVVIGVIIASIFAVLLSGHAWWRGQQNEDEVVMERLSKIIELPEEIPTIATVTDREKLVDQPFFAKAENGDKVIVYVQAKRAYLYRPKEDKIIDMTVVSQSPSSVSQTQGTDENVPVFKVNNK